MSEVLRLAGVIAAKVAELRDAPHRSIIALACISVAALGFLVAAGCLLAALWIAVAEQRGQALAAIVTAAIAALLGLVALMSARLHSTYERRRSQSRNEYARVALTAAEAADLLSRGNPALLAAAAIGLLLALRK